MSRAVGIDLGTTNSAVAILDRDGRPRIFTTALGSTTMPSLVWFSDEGPRVGESAIAGLQEQPEQTIYGIKRLLGRPFSHPEVRRLAKVLPYEITPSPNGDVWIALAGGERVSPEFVSALVLRELVQLAEASLGESVSEAVITVPAWFDSAQRQATKDAAAIAGIAVRRLLSEPTAASLGYGAHLGERGRYAVCDLGGGTFDVAVVDVGDGVFEVLANTGDPFLGGDDIDRIIVEYVVRDIRKTLGVDVTTDASVIDRLRLEAQRIKHELSTEQVAEFRALHLAAPSPGRSGDYTKDFTRDELNAWAGPLLRRLEGPTRDALAKADRSAVDIDQVLLVGGMMRMPAAQRQLARVFGREPTIVANPDEVVAIGAAISVAQLTGDIEGVLLVDVCARGIAVSVGDGEADIVIAANSVVPTRDHRVLLTQATGQRRLEFDLWEGEATDCRLNRHLARYAVVELPAAPAGDVLVVVEITIDVDGTLRVVASELISGERPPIETVVQAGLPRAEVTRLRGELRA